MDVLDNDVVLQRQSLADQHSVLANATDGLVVPHKQALDSSVVVRDHHLRAVGAAARVAHATSLKDHILTLEAVVLLHALASSDRSAPNLGGRTLCAAKVKSSVEHNDERPDVVQVCDKLGVRSGVHDFSASSSRRTNT